MQRRALCAWLCLMIGLFCRPASAWTDVEIGAPTTPGGSSVTGGAVTLTGAGAGEVRSGADQLHYTYQPHPGGDVEIIARLTAFTGVPHAGAGLMLRESPDATATTASVSYKFQDSTTNGDVIAATARDQARGVAARVKTRLSLPLWLRLVRVGPNFAAYKSPDGVLWSMIGNTSGGPFTPAGRITVGFFVFGSAAATATFDRITIRAPQMGYRSSWYGSTLGGTRAQGHVTRHTRALFTAPDGTCYTNSPFDEGGESAKIYKDGAVVKGIALGNTFGYEGSITRAGNHIFVAGTRYLYQTDLLGGNPIPMPLSVDLWSAPYINNISGLAVVQEELFISDRLHNKIRVATTAGPTVYYSVTNSTTNLTTQAIDTRGVPLAAPASVYQSQRETSVLPYRIPDLTPGAPYEVRLHFAEWEHAEAGKRLLKVTVGKHVIDNIDIYARAGAQYKAVVLPIENVTADGAGRLSIMLQNATKGNPDGSGVLCGIEVLANGVQVRAINCGGPAADGYLAEVYDLPGRAFDVTRPGPMVADKRGRLWIIQQGNDFRQTAKMTTAYPAAIRCYGTNGVFTGQVITDLLNPTALAYDAKNDRLLVADNSASRLNIRLYDLAAAAPTYLRSVGQPGGIYAGKTPGLLNDPASGGYQRFYGLTGVGVDADGNIYVACDQQGTDLRKYTPDGQLVWMLNGLFFCNTPDIDPDSDGADVYAPYFHGRMNYAKAAPGSEWSYTGYNWHAPRFGNTPRPHDSQAIVRRVGATRALTMYTSGQGVVGYVGIFRYDGEIAIPCGQIRMNGHTMEVWVDQDGDGVEAPGEVATAPGGGIAQFAVDDRGDIWITSIGAHTPMLRHMKLLGLTAAGAPRYGLGPTECEDIPYPNPGLGLIGMTSHRPAAYYDAVGDIMYLMGPAGDVTPGESAPCYLARYDQWSRGNRDRRWLTLLPRPESSVNFCYEVDKPWGCAHMWMGFDGAGDKLYLTELWGPTHVFQVDTGAEVMIVNPGPEVAGFTAWQDATMGITAYERANGETILFVENSGYQSKCNLYRIPGSATVNAPLAWPVGGSYVGAQAITLQCSTTGAAIHYTLDGTVPTPASPRYRQPIPIAADTTLTAKAFRAGSAASQTLSGRYTIRYYDTRTVARQRFELHAEVPTGVARLSAPTPTEMEVVADAGQLTLSADAAFGSKAVRNTNGNSGVMVMPLPAPVALTQLGDQLTLSFAYRLDAPPTGRAATPRFGLYHSGGTPAAAGQIAASTIDDPGYFAELSVTNAAGYPAIIGEEKGTASFILGGADIETLATRVGGAGTSVTDTSIYHVTFRLTLVRGRAPADPPVVQIDLTVKNSRDEVTLLLRAVDDGVTGGAQQTVAPFTRFDEVAFRNSAQAVRYDDITVTFSTPTRTTAPN
jgi:hypothetical protein